MKLTRQESILIHPKRHQFSMDMTTACDETGKLTAMKLVAVTDNGAYASWADPFSSAPVPMRQGLITTRPSTSTGQPFTLTIHQPEPSADLASLRPFLPRN